MLERRDAMRRSRRRVVVQNADGPSATWSVRRNTLTLAPVGGKDACDQRGNTWTGQRTRVE